jgi:hypothetical protein
MVCDKCGGPWGFCYIFETADKKGYTCKRCGYTKAKYEPQSPPEAAP